MYFFYFLKVLTTIAVLICSVILRLVKLEDAEKEIEEEEEENEMEKEKHNSKSAFLRGGRSARQVAPILEDDENEENGRASSGTSVVPSENKKTNKKNGCCLSQGTKRCISAHWLNEIALAAYFAAVIISTAVVTAIMGGLHGGMQPDSDFTSIQEYKVNE